VAAAGGKDPRTPVTPSPYPGAQRAILSAMSTIEPSFRKDQASLKADCLRRDGRRCVISGKERVRTRCAHILPFALRNFNEQNAQEVRDHSMNDILNTNYIRLRTRLQSGGLSIDTFQT